MYISGFVVRMFGKHDLKKVAIFKYVTHTNLNTNVDLKTLKTQKVEACSIKQI